MARELGFSRRLTSASLLVRGCCKQLPAVCRSFGCAFCRSKILALLQPVRIPAQPTIIKIPSDDEIFIMARELGFEPRTDRLHIILIFRIGVDYIIIPMGCEALRQLSLLLADSLWTFNDSPKGESKLGCWLPYSFLWRLPVPHLLMYGASSL